MLRAASATFIPFLLNSRASEALSPLPAPTMSAVRYCDMEMLLRLFRRSMEGDYPNGKKRVGVCAGAGTHPPI